MTVENSLDMIYPRRVVIGNFTGPEWTKDGNSLKLLIQVNDEGRPYSFRNDERTTDPNPGFVAVSQQNKRFH